MVAESSEVTAVRSARLSDTAERLMRISSAAAVDADIKFVVKTGLKPIQYAESNVDTTPSEYHRVAVQNARVAGEAFSLGSSGFELKYFKTSAGQFDDPEAIRREYYPEIACMLRECTGAAQIHFVDHRIRASRPIEGAFAGAYRPLRAAHNDYSSEIVPKRLAEILGQERAREWLSERVLQINVWRPLNGVVEEVPLALCDARSIEPDDLVAAEFRHPDRTSENYLLRHNPSQRWYYFPEMCPEETVLIKGYDSRNDVARFTPHAAIDVGASPNVRPRLSIEVRAFLRVPRHTPAGGIVQ